MEWRNGIAWRPTAGIRSQGVLSRGDRYRLGNAIEYRLRRKTNAMFDRSLQKNLPSQLEQIKAYSIADRRRLKAQWQRRHGKAEYDPEKDDSALGDLILDARDAYEIWAAKISGTGDLRTEARPPKILKEILASVARAISRRCGIALTERHAKTCLSEYRRDRAEWYSKNT